MICSKCGGAVRATHTYKAGDSVRTTRRYCKDCDTTFTSVTFLVEDPTGARKLAREILEGKKTPKVE